MGVVSELKGMSSAEDIFQYLGVEYDPQVLNVSRLHILRLMGQLLRAEGAEQVDEDDVRSRYRTHLEQAYAELIRKGPLEQRLFKVHKDAVKPKSDGPKPAFVPLSALSSDEGKSS